MRVFVNNLPNNLNNDGLVAEFFRHGITILATSIQPAWNKGYCWADVVVTATDYGKILRLSNKLIFGRKIKVKPFLSKANRHQEPLGDGKGIHLNSEYVGALIYFISELMSKPVGPSKATVFLWEKVDGHYICQPQIPEIVAVFPRIPLTFIIFLILNFALVRFRTRPPSSRSPLARAPLPSAALVLHRGSAYGYGCSSSGIYSPRSDGAVRIDHLQGEGDVARVRASLAPPTRPTPLFMSLARLAFARRPPLLPSRIDAARGSRAFPALRVPVRMLCAPYPVRRACIRLRRQDRRAWTAHVFPVATATNLARSKAGSKSVGHCRTPTLCPAEGGRRSGCGCWGSLACTRVIAGGGTATRISGDVLQCLRFGIRYAQRYAGEYTYGAALQYEYVAARRHASLGEYRTTRRRTRPRCICTSGRGGGVRVRASRPPLWPVVSSRPTRGSALGSRARVGGRTSAEKGTAIGAWTWRGAEGRVEEADIPIAYVKGGGVVPRRGVIRAGHIGVEEQGDEGAERPCRAVIMCALGRRDGQAPQYGRRHISLLLLHLPPAPARTALSPAIGLGFNLALSTSPVYSQSSAKLDVGLSPPRSSHPYSDSD
ncbi:hypothetical protein B0H14DRAFT_2573696 [Mycena olivaceomarginata]|nr:hypothetical protein B0H14DRAFT_2573696 [Mycena olivaceomarginata]